MDGSGLKWIKGANIGIFRVARAGAASTRFRPKADLGPFELDANEQTFNWLLLPFEFQLIRCLLKRVKFTLRDLCRVSLIFELTFDLLRKNIYILQKMLDDVHS